MRRAVLALLGLAACGRGGFDEGVPGLGRLGGVMLSTPGSLVLEDGHYDLATTSDGRGYAIAWMEYPVADRSAHLMFAIVDENRGLVVEPTRIELLPERPGGVRLWSSPAGYVLVIHIGTEYLFFGLDTVGQILARRADPTNPYNGLEMTATADGFVGVYHNSTSIVSFTIDARGAQRSAPAVIEAAATSTTQVAPAIASSADGALGVAWVDTRTTSERLRFARLDAGGRPLGPSVAIYDNGMTQGLPYLVPDGETGFLLSYDGYSEFPQNLLRIDANGKPLWPGPVIIYDESHYHDTLDVAGTREGHAGFAWVTEDHTLLTNIEFTSVNGKVSDPPAVPPPVLVTDPNYSFCYPEVARASHSFGAAFAGHVDGSLAMFLVVVPD